MGGLSLPHLIILALVVLILFGRGRISEMMGDFGKGIKSFKRGMDEETDRPLPPRLEQHAPAPMPQGYASPAQGPYGQPMSYDPVYSPATTDLNPPHPAVPPAPARPPQQTHETMPYDPVSVQPASADGARREG
jgi:sec-independent protein translocase protein TatA